MKRIKLVLVFLAFTAIGSCQSKGDKTSKEVAISGKHTETLAKVTLNNGQLWQANPETTLGIKSMQKIIAEFNPKESALTLKENLTAEFALIFKKCTMNGEAHNQLHNYLYPLKLKINSIEETNKDVKKSKIAVYLDKYSLYFR